MAASSQVQVPGYRDLAYKGGRKDGWSIQFLVVGEPRTGGGVASGHAAAGPRAWGFQTIEVTDMRDVQPT